MVQKAVSLNGKDAKSIIILKKIVDIEKNKKFILLEKINFLINRFILLDLVTKNTRIYGI